MKMATLDFTDDGDIPNHPSWPLIIYAAALDRSVIQDEFAFDKLFKQNGWDIGFRNGIYPFPHYHSNSHEALGIARGSATVRFGGDTGQIVEVQAGDAALLPAGTGHQLISATDDLLVIGAYPPGPVRDLMRSGELERTQIRKRIAAVVKPPTDPICGQRGPMLDLWK